MTLLRCPKSRAAISFYSRRQLWQYSSIPRYPRQLSAGADNAVIALSEAVKLYVADTLSNMGARSGKDESCQCDNDLVVKFRQLDYYNSLRKK